MNNVPLLNRKLNLFKKKFFSSTITTNIDWNILDPAL